MVLNIEFLICTVLLQIIFKSKKYFYPKRYFCSFHNQQTVDEFSTEKIQNDKKERCQGIKSHYIGSKFNLGKRKRNFHSKYD